MFSKEFCNERREALKNIGRVLGASAILPFGIDRVVPPQESVEKPVIGEEIKEILSLTPKMAFDEKGNLHYVNSNNIQKPVVLMQTNHDLYRPENEAGQKVKKVRLLIHHFDGGEEYSFLMGQNRTAERTVHGLNNPKGGSTGPFTPTVHFCVDGYPINTDGDKKSGYGILQSQKGSGEVDHPFKGQHVMIGINLQNGKPDINRIYTKESMQKFGINSNLISIVEKNGTDIDSLSVAYEQIGCRYSRNFPENFPSNRQIANTLGLTLAVSEQYKLSPWDNVAHIEIQEKPDTGYEHINLMRYLFGVSALIGKANPELVFGKDSPSEYFLKIKKYFIDRAGSDRYKQWNDVYRMDEFMSYLKGK